MIARMSADETDGGEMADRDFEAFFDSSPFHRLLGCELIERRAMNGGLGRLTLRLPFSAQLAREAGSGRFHGGVIAALIDTAGGFALMSVTGRDTPSTSVSLHYLRPARAADLIAEAVVRRRGRSSGLVDVEVRQDGDRLIALGRVCLSIPPDASRPTGRAPTVTGRGGGDD
jgi:uncharacterized protein (TIGR00369 family)